jgi:hypothetical protein
MQVFLITLYPSGAQPFYRSGKIFKQNSPAGKKRAVKHHAGQKVYGLHLFLVIKAYPSN